MRLNKNIKIFVNYFLGPFLFIWLSWSIYRQIRDQHDLSSSWLHIRQAFHSTKIWNLVVVLLLMVVNWGVEAYKWKLAVEPVQPVSLLRAYKAILSGVSFSVSTPNRVGEYFGRVLYMDEGNRLRTISLTIVCGMSQLIITLAAGIAALIVLKQKLVTGIRTGDIDVSFWIKMLEYGSVIILIFLTLLYFRLSLVTRLFTALPFIKKYQFLVTELKGIDATLLIRLMSLSAIRYAVFSLQYFLLFSLFGVNIGWINAFWAVSLVFLILALVPSFAIAELGLRGEVGWQVLQIFSANAFGIFWATATIWIINLIVPAVAGSLLILSIKIFKNRNERDKDSGNP
jgi:hypothetical protein